jgi:hypothetical protein
VTSLLGILLRLLNRDEQKKPEQYELFFFTEIQRYEIGRSSFWRSTKTRKVGSVLLECTPGKLMA